MENKQTKKNLPPKQEPEIWFHMPRTITNLLNPFGAHLLSHQVFSPEKAHSLHGREGVTVYLTGYSKLLGLQLWIFPQAQYALNPGHSLKQ